MISSSLFHSWNERERNGYSQFMHIKVIEMTFHTSYLQHAKWNHFSMTRGKKFKVFQISIVGTSHTLLMLAQFTLHSTNQFQTSIHSFELAQYNWCESLSIVYGCSRRNADISLISTSVLISIAQFNLSFWLFSFKKVILMILKLFFFVLNYFDPFNHSGAILERSLFHIA